MRCKHLKILTLYYVLTDGSMISAEYHCRSHFYVGFSSMEDVLE